MELLRLYMGKCQILPDSQLSLVCNHGGQMCENPTEFWNCRFHTLKSNRPTPRDAFLLWNHLLQHGCFHVRGWSAIRSHSSSTQNIYFKEGGNYRKLRTSILYMTKYSSRAISKIIHICRMAKKYSGSINIWNLKINIWLLLGQAKVQFIYVVNSS